MVALLTAPDTTGVKTPMNSIKIGKNFPNLCFLKVRNAIKAAICKKKQKTYSAAILIKSKLGIPKKHGPKSLIHRSGMSYLTYQNVRKLNIYIYIYFLEYSSGCRCK